MGRFVARLMWDNALTIVTNGPDGLPVTVRVRLQDGLNKVGVVVEAPESVTFAIEKPPTPTAASVAARASSPRRPQVPARDQADRRRGQALSHPARQSEPS